eukprot:CAMPEP_0202912724 /NCGR_PEP_ID=MMETSP1392-20130828/58523_1 /ASSEMBLY_ACC=CAM_ASM_000868 /TAXON_ID=225041 /ORGANISM="Chlamydomonas chlamydogama, Strain SAG 11-48b" /LENGTH=52 /DNA_ID=CAMNT_0049603737 /DNA_START=97 /DNA_END=251 /DNA_ORIENTATION=+
MALTSSCTLDMMVVKRTASASEVVLATVAITSNLPRCCWYTWILSGVPVMAP